MMMRKSPITLFLWPSFLVLALLGFIVMFQLNDPSTPIDDNHSPDAYMTEVSYREYDKQGQLRAWIDSPDMQHYPNQDRSEFKTPTIHLYTSDGEPWKITAEQGYSLHGIEKVFLSGKVNIEQHGHGNSPQTTVKTPHITVYPAKSLAKTNAPVTITRPGSITQGIGLEANFHSGQFKLLSQSRGQYEPNSP